MASNVGIVDWIIAARPKTLTASILPVIAAHLLVARESTHPISIPATALALFCGLLIQVGTNYYNDIVDFKNGVDNEKRSGPQRLLQSGKVTERSMRRAAHFCFLGALFLGIPLVLKAGLPILFIGLASIALGYSYFSPPLKLAYRGLAEPFVIIFFGILAVVGIEWLHLQTVSLSALLLGLQFGLLATVLLVVNNVRDFEVDAQHGKKTLVARFGRNFGISEVLVFFMLCFLVSLCPLAVSRFPFDFFWILPALLVVKALFEGRTGCALNKTLATAAITHLIFGIGICAVLLS